MRRWCCLHSIVWFASTSYLNKWTPASAVPRLQRQRYFLSIDNIFKLTQREIVNILRNYEWYLIFCNSWRSFPQSFNLHFPIVIYGDAVAITVAGTALVSPHVAFQYQMHTSYNSRHHHGLWQWAIIFGNAQNHHRVHDPLFNTERLDSIHTLYKINK